MQTVSVRIPEDDLLWLSTLQTAGSSSPSDKIRSLIQDARRRADGVADYVGCVGLMREMMRPVQEAVQSLEHDEQKHSEIMTLVMGQLPELMAAMVAGGAEGEMSLEQARALESRLTAGVMRLLLGVLRLAVTQRVPAYDEGVLNSSLPEVFELARLIQTIRSVS